MNLTNVQVQLFQEEGYLALPEFFSAREVAAMQAEIARLQRLGKLRNVTTEGDGATHSQTLFNLQLCPMSPYSPLFRAMPFHSEVVSVVRQLIGDPVVLHLDQVFLKPGQHGVGTNWHQDNAYFQIPDPLKGTALWTAVHEATVANGTIHVIPRRHKSALEHSRDPYSDHHIRCYPPEEEAIPIELPAGGVVLFAYGTPHCTRANQTDQARAGVALHFLNADQTPFATGMTDPNMKHPHLTGPQADGGRAAYGVDVASSWREEVERALVGAAQVS